MNKLKAYPFLAILFFGSTSAMAEDAAGRWALSANVDGKDFTLDCRFQQTEELVTGACVDGPTGDATVKGGTSHPLVEGHAKGDAVNWVYQSSYAFFKFDVHYSGIRQGDHMTGTIAAAGKTGSFTASRVEP